MPLCQHANEQQEENSFSTWKSLPQIDMEQIVRGCKTVLALLNSLRGFAASMDPS